MYIMYMYMYHYSMLTPGTLYNIIYPYIVNIGAPTHIACASLETGRSSYIPGN